MSLLPCRRATAVALLALLLAGIAAVPPSYAQSQGMLGGFMELTNVEFSEGTRTFGPGQVVTVSGAVPFIPWCPSMASTHKGRAEGFLDFFPVADLYVIKDDGQPLAPLTELKDVNGTPNRVIGTAEGVFVEETVGITKPAGNLDAGRYRVVMNQCLTGVYDPLGGDIVLGNNGNLGFEVVLPSDLPPIQYNDLKNRAKDYSLALDGTTIDLPLNQKLEIPGFCKLYSKLVDKGGLEAGSNLLSFAKIALDYCADLTHHWQGIAADPPDPNYQVFAELGKINYSFLPASTPLERAARNLGNDFAEQSAISQAFLSSVEKFQGAQQAGDDEYTMLQLQQMNKFINLLLGPGGAALRSYAALEKLDLALSQSSLASLQETHDLHAFIPEMRQAIGALFDPFGSRFLQSVDSNGVRHIYPYGLQAFISVYLGQDPFLPSENLPGIPQVRAFHGLPPIVFQHPVANAGGPYAAAPGRTITFDAGKSTDPNGDTLSFAWDLDFDGNFNDGVGAQVQSSFAGPGTRLVAVRATDPAGNSNVAYALVKIGDINSQDIIAMPLSRELYRVAPGGAYSTLKAGYGYNFGGLHALHVDVNQDIWVLDDSSIQHYDSDGNLLNTITPQQVSLLAGQSLKSFRDFALDGRGDIIALAIEGLGPGTEDISGYYQIYSSNLDGRTKLLRIAKDGTRASFIADVNQYYQSRQVVNGQTLIEVDASGGGLGEDQSVAIDPNGNIVVSAMNANDPLRCSCGVFTIDPDSGQITEVIPPGRSITSFVTEAPWGDFFGVTLTFGGNNLFSGPTGYRTNSGGIEVDPGGGYIMGHGEEIGGLRLYRVPIPPQLFVLPAPGYIANFVGLDVFPTQLVTAGSVYLTFQDIAINSSGDYLVGGGDFSGQLGSGIFRVTPDSEVFKVSDVVGPFSQVFALDVVPEERQVTAKDVVTAPQLRLSGMKIVQDSCPGSLQFSVTVTNAGSGDTLLPARLFFYDGEPHNNPPVVASVLTPGIIPAGGSVTVQAVWANPTPGEHELFAATLGANPVGATYQVCISADIANNPIVLTPDSGSSALGDAYTVSAAVRDIFGQGVSGVALDFTVSGANSVTGQASTGADGKAQFTYSGVNPGLDNIVASTFGAASNGVTDTWAGAVNRAPIASAGSDQIVEATSPQGAVVNLSAAGSSDPDGDPLTFAWTGPFGALSGVAISPTFTLGSSQATVTVSDGHGHDVPATVNITVRDTTPPTVTAPAPITIPATEAGGARGGAWPALAAFLAGGSAADIADPAAQRLSPQVGGGTADNNTLFGLNATSPVSFRFRDASGNVGAASSSVSVILGQPRLYGQIVAKGSSVQGYYVDLRLSNTGTGNARNLQVNQIAFRTLSGTGTVSLLSAAPPLVVGSLDVGAATTLRLYLNVPSTVTRFGITETGSVQDVIGTNYSYSIAQSLYP